jgi:hypothetical protein
LQTEQRSIKSDIGSDSAPVFGHVIHEETDAELVKLIADDVICEPSGETHEVIVGNGSGDDDVHEAVPEQTREGGLKTVKQYNTILQA